MATITTPTTNRTWSPDEVASYSPTDQLADSLILTLTTKAGEIEGDAPSLRVPFIADATAGIVAEGSTITPTEPALDEHLVTTVKVAQLSVVSREQTTRAGAAEAIAASMRRSIVALADEKFLSSVTAPEGLAALITTSGGTIGTTAWGIYDAVASLEAAGAKASHWVMHPTDWATLAKIPEVTAGNKPVLGNLADATARTLAGLPVVVSRFATVGKALLIDRAEIVAAYGALQLARSEDAYFASDAVGIRATWRIGWGVPRPARAGRVLTVSVA